MKNINGPAPQWGILRESPYQYSGYNRPPSQDWLSCLRRDDYDGKWYDSYVGHRGCNSEWHPNYDVYFSFSHAALKFDDWAYADSVAAILKSRWRGFNFKVVPIPAIVELPEHDCFYYSVRKDM